MPNKPTTPVVSPPVPHELIELIRGQNVMLDTDLAELYQVETRALNQVVRRNDSRFREDFMFQLTKEAAAALRSQIGS
jgi:ORF6N domain